MGWSGHRLGWALCGLACAGLDMGWLGNGLGLV
jgi:hypothetical protein